ncbi:tRNA (guanine-N(7)-)-methyltransferase non-catalytic subunit trm82 [Thelotrema lepadinum]|nr:tRNA (guanine-N(7)-)-methyltransferase non-catalytic subunit trm82 [Thelotrema lepadinum]
MLTPIQRLLYCSRQGSGRLNVLLAASGPSIRTFNADGICISKWSHLEPNKDIKGTRDRSPGSHEGKESYEEKDSEALPGKRRRLSDAGNASEASSVEVVVENGRKKRRKSKRKDLLIPSVVNLTATSDGKHVVAVTGEDKSLRVLELLENGVLNQISQRVMPKRPSAVTLTHDQQTILCADKFGDVYAMPLLWTAPSNPDSAPEPPDPTESYTSFEAPPKHNAPKPFAPAASSATVHTKKNLRALAEQQRLATRPDLMPPKKTPNKDALNFPHKLLLGHVSLLTDLLAITLASPENFPGQRSYILTSDRDEHIRVSRGMPQAHIIESFCLGHGQFVNKMHVPAWRPEVLVSGGGDEFLMVWEWLRGETTQQVDLLGHVEGVRRGAGYGKEGAGAEDGEGLKEQKEGFEVQKEGEEEHKEGLEGYEDGSKGQKEGFMANREDSERQKEGSEGHKKGSKRQQERSEGPKSSTIAVSGIWSMQTGSLGEQTGELLVACEAVPALFVFKLGTEGTLNFRSALLVEGNVLDIAIRSEARTLFYTVDNVHAPATTKEERDLGADERRVFVGAYRFVSERDEWVKEEGDLVEAMNAFANTEEDLLTAEMDAGALSDLLYGIEHLRKRGKEEEAGDDGD